ncbi:hypothetical protein MIR68_006343 [Amoeboaphelidium protococcarum]|nr:hypothetical protein MIR68_006343 [Amoeboaphelidium protococcarum]
MINSDSDSDSDALKLESDPSNVSVFLLIQLLILTLVASFVLKKFRIKVVHETLVGLVLGMIVGLMSVGKLSVAFDNRYFFNLLLPPIILQSGWEMEVSSFLFYFWRIMLFAFLGTFISSFIVGYFMYLLVMTGSLNLTIIECFMYGSILSSTDPVTVLAMLKNLSLDKSLYAVIFGESVLNDAVSIVLYQTLESFRGHPITGESIGKALLHFLYSFATSFLLGVGVALSCAFIIGRVLKGIGSSQYGTLETCVVALIAYSSYFLSNALELSGIVSLLFCGITLKHYVQPTLSRRTKRTLGSLFQLTSQLSETFIFLYLGITLFASSYRGNTESTNDTSKGNDIDGGLINNGDVQVMVWKPAEIFLCFIGVLTARAVVFPLSWMVNFYRNSRKVGIYRASKDGFQWTMVTYRWLRSRVSGRSNSSVILPQQHSDTNGQQQQQQQLNLRAAIPMAHQIILWFAGLRGAIAFALSMDMKPSQIPLTVNGTASNSTLMKDRTPVEEIRTTTLAVCVLSILILGGSIGFVVRWISENDRRQMRRPSIGFLNQNHSNNNNNDNEIDGNNDNDYYGDDNDEDEDTYRYERDLKWLKWIDDKIMRPIFVGKPIKYSRSQEDLDELEMESQDSGSNENIEQQTKRKGSTFHNDQSSLLGGIYHANDLQETKLKPSMSAQLGLFSGLKDFDNQGDINAKQANGQGNSQSDAHHSSSKSNSKSENMNRTDSVQSLGTVRRKSGMSQYFQSQQQQESPYDQYKPNFGFASDDDTSAN